MVAAPTEFFAVKPTFTSVVSPDAAPAQLQAIVPTVAVLQVVPAAAALFTVILSEG